MKMEVIKTKSEEAGHGSRESHKLPSIPTSRSTKISYKTGSMDEVTMGVMGSQGFWQSWRCLADKMASCDSPSVEPACNLQV